MIEEVAFGFKPSGILSNWAAVSTQPKWGTYRAYHISVHVGVDGPVRARVVPGSNENGIALSDGDIQLPHRIWLYISLWQ